ncbi:glycerate kinase type-2 family protein [Ruegeria sp. MALMAid1280]|uniref:glycerate kinase type-2 family protein n=1 Tax=Ruegeria sp. MALMAid1280 TaxID=3411634 RepID=UPI003BA104E4
MTKQLSINLRDSAAAIFAAAVTAADPAVSLRRRLRTTPLPSPKQGGRSILIAIGKAAPAMMAETLQHVRGDHVALAVTHPENQALVSGATVLTCAHPIPDERGLKAGRQIISLLSAACKQDQIIALISGGGSALVPAPVDGLTLSDKIAVNEVLLSSGLDIVQMNLVRQHLSQLKGGGFLRLGSPARVTAYILSDVIGDDLRAVASGPTTVPIGSHADARRACIEAGIWHRLPKAARTHLELSIPEHAKVNEAANNLIGSNTISLEAAFRCAAQSCRAEIVSDALIGDVSVAAEQIFQAAQTAPRDRPTALLFGGETTVRLQGTGRGGRNQELALRVAQLAQERPIPGNWVFLSGGTDGRDGPTPAAGAVVDAGTLARIRASGHDPASLLASNDSHRALTLSGDLLITGATGTNVADIQVFLLGSNA